MPRCRKHGSGGEATILRKLLPSAIAAATTLLTRAAATGVATAQARRARRNASADAEPAARLGISTLRTTNQDDSAWQSLAPGGTTSDTMS
jgi:hypothetical protein